jgi:hypothetical protein
MKAIWADTDAGLIAMIKVFRAVTAEAHLVFLRLIAAVKAIKVISIGRPRNCCHERVISTFWTRFDRPLSAILRKCETIRASENTRDILFHSHRWRWSMVAE